MLHLISAVIATLSLSGEVPDDGQDYLLLDFEVPEGVVEMEVQHSDGSDRNILDWGLWSPQGFRGWGGGLEDPAIVGPESSRGYLPGAIDAGTWTLVVGKALIEESPASYEVEIIFRDAATLESRERSTFDSPVLRAEAGWYQGDFHVHSSESGDASASFEEIRDLALSRGLDFVALSDHNTVSQHALQDAFQSGATDLLFVGSAEVTTYGGHGGALGVRSHVDHRVGVEGQSARGIIEAVDAAGGAFIINHPNLELGTACIGCAWNHEDTPWDKVAGIEIHTGNYDYVPVFGRANLQLWDARLDEGHRITALGGSDDHRAGQGEGPTQSPIGSPTTVVYAQELSESGVVEAVRAGRAYVKLRSPDDPDVELLGSTLAGEGMIGDELEGESIELEARVSGGQGRLLLLLENGERVEEVLSIDSDDYVARWERKIPVEGARYRIHIVEGSSELVITNHIYASFAEEPGSGGCGCEASGSGGAVSALLLLLLAALRRARSALVALLVTFGLGAGIASAESEGAEDSPLQLGVNLDLFTITGSSGGGSVNHFGVVDFLVHPSLSEQVQLYAGAGMGLLAPRIRAGVDVFPSGHGSGMSATVGARYLLISWMGADESFENTDDAHDFARGAMAELGLGYRWVKSGYSWHLSAVYLAGLLEPVAGSRDARSFGDMEPSGQALFQGGTVSTGLRW